MFATNPQCLADFVKALVQSPAETIPTPMHKQAAEAAPAPVEPNTTKTDKTETALEARKQFWSKYKRPAPAANFEEDILSILSKPTLVLGESTDSLVSETQHESQEPPTEGHKELPEDSKEIPEERPEQPEESPAKPEEPADPSNSQLGVGGGCDQGKAEALPEGEQTGETPNEQVVPQPVETQEVENNSIELQQILPDNQLGDPTLFPTGTPNTPPEETLQVETEGSKSPQPTPPEPTLNSCVAEALKRVSTCDLDGGTRPPQSLVSTVVDGASTVVLMDIGGTFQPVTIPLTKSQCLQAGLKLANEVEDVRPPVPKHVVEQEKPPAKTQIVEKEQETPSPVIPAPGHHTSSQGVPTDGLEEPNSKQMLKNLYMRFSRSQKRYLT